MTQEKKAKAYDNLVERLKDLKFAYRFSPLSDTIEEKFPELAESEDERVIKSITRLIKAFYDINFPTLEGFSRKELLAWLEKQSEQKTVDEIAKEVCKNKASAITFLKSAGIMNEKGELADEYKIEQVEQNPAWSDEDKDILFRTINDLKFLRDTISIDPKYAVNIIDIEREITWLKSLKDRYTWKPSDEQMKALWEVYQGGKEQAKLATLYNDLKKLRDK